MPRLAIADPPYLGRGARHYGIGSSANDWHYSILDLLGYDSDTDTVCDLFPGSGAVTHEIAAGVLL